MSGAQSKYVYLEEGWNQYEYIYCKYYYSMISQFLQNVCKNITTKTTTA